MRQVYHETSLDLKEKIQDEGLLPKPEKGFSNKYIIENKKYKVKKDISEFYGSTIINQILDELKENKYSQRKNCIFFHTSKETMNNKKLSLSVNYNDLHYPAYQIPYSIAKEIFTTSMSKIGENKEISKEYMERQANKYWSNVEEVKNKDRIKPRQELFVTKPIPPENIDIYKEWGN